MDFLDDEELLLLPQEEDVPLSDGLGLELDDLLPKPNELFILDPKELLPVEELRELVG